MAFMLNKGGFLSAAKVQESNGHQSYTSTAAATNTLNTQVGNSSGMQRSTVLHINNNNNIVYSSQWEIKTVIRSHNKEHISINLSYETHTHTQS